MDVICAPKSTTQKFDLLRCLTDLKYIDLKKIDHFRRLKIFTLRDLLFYLPSYYIQRKLYPDLKNIQHEDHVVIKGKITEILYPVKRTKPTKIMLTNETGSIALNYFKLHSYMKNIFRVGHSIIVSGKAEFYDYHPQINHPEIIFDSRMLTYTEPIYPLTYGLTNSQVRKQIINLLENLPEFSEWLPEDLIQEYNLLPFNDSIEIIHGFRNGNLADAKNRLKIEEALANQIGFRLIRNEIASNKGRSYKKADSIKEQIITNIGFKLTEDQLRAIQEIEDDQASTHQMFRMLQGDVGCGKTIVALITAANVISAGSQVAIMVPTEVLASQHHKFAEKIFAALGYESQLLTSKMTAKSKNEALDKIENGQAQIIVGTHALFQEKVKFKDLAYIIVDEQHRFGVQQRIELINKGNNPDVLIMSATPIPRTLSLTMFGDLAVSSINTMPSMRKCVDTYVSSIKKLDDVCSLVEKVISEDNRVFWICPLIENTEDDSKDYIDVDQRGNYLNKHFPDQVAKLHGLIPAEIKLDIIKKFGIGETKILVSTTVIEVGIDIPDATLIIIENAEKFGLAQLHQLRGRVGRSDKKSSCILLYGKKLSKIGLQRLNIMKNCNDGFTIAEQDLILRGEGDILGYKQSGEQSFRFVDISQDSSIISKCHKIAQKIEINDYVKSRILAHNPNMLNVEMKV